jgi:hypothetical protein
LEFDRLNVGDQFECDKEDDNKFVFEGAVVVYLLVAWVCVGPEGGGGGDVFTGAAVIGGDDVDFLRGMVNEVG